MSRAILRSVEYLFFILGLLTLFLVSRFVSSRLFFIFYSLTKNQQLAATLIGALYFPGVLVHEASHAFAAAIMGVRVSDMEFMPKFVDGALKLGSVRVEKTDPLRRTLIGVAPLVGGITAIFLVIWSATNLGGNNLLLLILAGILVFQIASTMFSSKKDLEGTGVFFVTLLVICLAIWFFEIPVLGFLKDFGISSEVQSFIARVNYFLGIAVFLNLGVAAVIYFLMKLRRH